MRLGFPPGSTTQQGSPLEFQASQHQDRLPYGGEIDLPRIMMAPRSVAPPPEDEEMSWRKLNGKVLRYFTNININPTIARP